MIIENEKVVEVVPDVVYAETEEQAQPEKKDEIFSKSKLITSKTRC